MYLLSCLCLPVQCDQDFPKQIVGCVVWYDLKSYHMPKLCLESWLAVPDSSMWGVVVVVCGFTEPLKEWWVWWWWAPRAHTRTNASMAMERNSSAPHTIRAYLLRGLHCSWRIWENADSTVSHSTSLSIPGYTSRSFCIELV